MCYNITMTRKQKKLFKQHLKKVIEYAIIVGVEDIQTVSSLIKPLDHNGAMDAENKVMSLMGEMNLKQILATILHELGHHEDDCNTPKEDPHLAGAYIKLDKNEPLTLNQKIKVRACEDRAWYYARGIAKKLDIKLGPWFDKEEKEALKTYQYTTIKKN